MPEKPKRNRDYVILTAAMLGLGVAGCDKDDSKSHAPPAASTPATVKGKAAPAAPPAMPPKPAGGRMGHLGRASPVTPTLMGRWQTRVFLNLLIGVPFTAFWMLIFDQFTKNPPDVLEFWHMPMLLAWLTGLGLVLDVVYIGLQRLRWDRDWPPAFQLLGGLVEGGAILALSLTDLLPGVTHCDDDIPQFPIAYLTMLFAMFFFLFGPMKVLFPRWRFAGGQLIGGL
jgi:hypothetical protein